MQTTPPAAHPTPHITVREILGVCGFCLVIFLAYLSTLNYPMQRCDDIYYVIGAKSIAAGMGYADISRPDAPYLTKYAPLPSLTLAPFVAMVGENWRMLRFVPMVWTLLCVVPLYPLLRSRTTHRGALLILTLTLLNPIALHAANLQGNSAFGAALVFSIVYLLDRMFPRRPTRGTLLLIAFALALSFYTHRANLALIIGATAYLAVRYRRPRAACAVFALVAALSFPWMWRSYTHTGHWISQQYETEIVYLNQKETGNDALPAPIRHVLYNLSTVPIEIGHGMWPWSKGSGGQFWPGLARRGLSWTQPLILGLVVLLTAIGWISEWRRGYHFPEWQLPLHMAMMLVFFVGFQYFGLFIPFFYLYLWRGATAVATSARSSMPFLPAFSPSQRRLCVVLGFWLLFLPMAGKNIKVFWGGSRTDVIDRDPRWAWVEEQVPPGEGVYWTGLENYAWAPWRWYDSRRMAVGVTDSEVEEAVTSPSSVVRYLAVPIGSPAEMRLKNAAWEPVFIETDIPAPPPVQMLEMLTPAQRAYMALAPPPQTLWRRPER